MRERLICLLNLIFTILIARQKISESEFTRVHMYIYVSMFFAKYKITVYQET